MKKKLFVTLAAALSLSLIASAIPSTVNALSKINKSSIPQEFSGEITAKKPGRGETVSFLPEAISKFWQMDDLLHTYKEKSSEIGELQIKSTGLDSWLTMPIGTEAEKEARREVFRKYDLFAPTNNVLSWDSKVAADEYRVIISQDKSFSTIEREYVVDGSKTSVTFDNPYTGTDYYWQVIATKSDTSKVYSDIFNFTTANLPRTVLIDGVSNTRDLGGNLGNNNMRMKEGLVYRGMGLESISEEAKIEFKNNLGIKTELDLRGSGEGLSNYCDLPNYFNYSSPYDYYNGAQGSHYIDFMDNGSLVTSFGNAIKVMSRAANYPIYFHCAVGRDRTGWLGLVLNFLCGVSEEVALKEFCLSLFSTSGAYTKGDPAFYDRFNRIVGYLNTFEGNNISEKTENYLIQKAGVSAKQCDNVRNILLGDIDTGFVPGTTNPDAYTGLVKVTFRRSGTTPIIKMINAGSKVSDPGIEGNGTWYHGDDVWDFENDVVNEDIYLDYVAKNKCKVSVRYNGIDLPNESFDVDYNHTLDYSRFNKEGYTFKVYDDSYNELTSLVVTDDIIINVIYKSTNGLIPKSNSRVIVLAGQSNGAGVAHYEYLEKTVDQAKLDEINNGYENVQMTGYSHGHYYEDFSKVNATSTSITTDNIGTYGIEVGLAERLSKAFPDETTYIVKHAYGGASLNYDWISPSGAEFAQVCPEFAGSPNERGWLYTGLLDSVNRAFTMIKERTNTVPMIEGFMWMQGESDAAYEQSNNLYLRSFNAMMDDFLTTFKNNISYKFALYDAAISETSVWDYAKSMNALKRSRVDDKNVYIETNERLTTLFEPYGTATDNAHYDAACYIDLGHMFADAYLEKTVRGYTHNAIEIEMPEKLVMVKGQTYDIVCPKVYFNGEEVNAKMTYFAQQHKGIGDNVYWYFTVNDNSTLKATKIGKSKFRITAYYQDEVRTIIVPVEVVAE